MIIDYVAIGKKLASARKSAHMSIDTVSEKTRIQAKYIQAIENGQVDKLPGIFYVKAFIRQYANTVKLDPNTIFDKYTVPEDEKPKLAKAQKEEDLLNDKKIIVGDDMIPRAGVSSVAKKTWNKYNSKIPVILLGVFFLAALFSGWQALSKLHENSKNSSQVLIDSSISSESKQVATESSKSKKELSQKDESSSSSNSVIPLTKAGYNNSLATYNFFDDKTHDVVIQVSANTWTTVEIDGKQVFSGIISAGAQQAFSLDEKSNTISIHMGNPVAAVILFDEQNINFMDGAPVLTTDVTINRTK
ncbi:MAG: DUF4115 domain-containing protein [Lactobacillaceae bacterium]|jgi:cytoskeletal protein RodZ|nr:DUF4115 domain-containing protein [Lactobacillaceae bacterium]